MDWVITIPQNVNWAEYQKEMAACAEFDKYMNYRTPFRSKACAGDRCYIVYRGRVVGWMSVVGVSTYPDGFECTTTKKWWPPGHYIQRSGPFTPVDGPPMRGFQGIRRYYGQKD